MPRLFPSPHYPRWVDDRPLYNLREVAPNLYVGGERAPLAMDWGLVVDVSGAAQGPGAAARYRRVRRVISAQMDDGDAFAPGVLDRIYQVVALDTVRGPQLIHCAAGLSRSVSAAYAVLRRMYGLSHEEALRRVKADPRFPVSTTLESARRWVGRAR